VAPSTVRFYERAGLLSPPRRAANGYRLFDESALEEMAFIARAKRIGMSLEDISDLVAAWSAGECRSLQARLRMFLTGRIGQVHEQVAELGRFERQLRSVLDRLSAHDPGPERCGKGCICETDLDLHRSRDLRQRPSVTPLPPDGKVGLTRFDGHPSSGVRPRKDVRSWRAWGRGPVAAVRSPRSSRPR
jgi:DNA-binding transcriptional MerR regulator